ncbi:hypothetical protein [Helicobacter typhlonius]|uniref:hypothetical protein n=1 Tax=Helicobacter typhlonius TaxID=76936 RepID=UPI002FE254B1
MFFKWCLKIGGALAVGSPVLFAMIAIMIEPVGIGFAIGYALAFAPFIFLAFCVLGVILEGIYTFCTRKLLLPKLKEFTIFRARNGHFLISFKRQNIFHKLEIKLLGDMRCQVWHSTRQSVNQEWREQSSQQSLINEFCNKNLPLVGNLPALFTFLDFCAKVPLVGDKDAILLHRGMSIYWDFPLLNDEPLPQEIQSLHKREKKVIIKRFFALCLLIITPIFALWLYLQSAFYPCSIYYAVQEGDTKK